MSRIVFVEYRINPEQRESYLSIMKQLLQYKQDVLWYEGTDQPNVFVEQWLNTTSEDYIRIKTLRLEETSEWDQVTACIPGGKSKLHIWEFQQLNSI
ncbi:hypothetical protein [Paenibacillus sp. 481]|uniref:hypothetical protein n=1 Tax=Paenibacillus sp. 481 TaxID=2835869 RepID=UPI001E3C576F|nr:hypothetical protein [Paenibacillus sp. 481]UHA74641.1 hypothetical protein KIK04_06030 [Paenibacillus sp. 481]